MTKTEPSPQPSSNATATRQPASPTSTLMPSVTATIPPSATTTPPPSNTPPPPTQTPLPTHTQPPTITPTPTNTPLPTQTPLPTATPPPTNTPLPTATPKPINVPINTLTDGMQNVTVIGNVVGTASFSRGFKFTLSDGTGQVTMVLWDNIYDVLPNPATLNYGARVQVKGDVSSFEGERQIEPSGEWDVTILQAGGLGAGVRAINEVTMEHVGWRIAVAGTIQSVSENSGGIKLTISDDTGQIEIFIWHNVFNRIPNNGVLRNAGTRIQLAGRVQEFRGGLEIVPALPYDVQILP